MNRLEIPNHDETLENIATLTLEKTRLAVSKYVSNSVLRDLDVRVVSDILGGDMSQAMCQMLVPGHRHTERRSGEGVHVPATWWDHLKQRFGWKYNTRVIPTTELIVYNMCPHLNVPSDGSHLEFLVHDGRTV